MIISELRSPLNGILGVSHLMIEDPTLSEEQRHNLQIITTSSSILLSLVNDLLDYSKLSVGKMTLSIAPFNLLEKLEMLVEMFQPQFHSKGLHLLLEYPARAPRSFWGDSGRIGQVLINLLSNGVKFTKKGHVLVRVEVTEVPKEKRSSDPSYDVKISVSDTGAVRALLRSDKL